MQHFTTEFEHCIHLGAAKIQKSIVEPSIKSDVNRIGYAQRKWCFSSGDHSNRSGHHFVRWWRGWLAFLGLGWSLLRDDTGELKRGFTGHALNHVKRLITDVVFFEKNLRRACTVTEVHETDGSLSTVGFHEACNCDFLINKIRSKRLNLAQSVRSI